MKHLPIEDMHKIGWRSPTVVSKPRRIALQIGLACGVGVMIGLLLLISPLLAIGCTLLVIIIVAALQKPVLLC